MDEDFSPIDVDVNLVQSLLDSFSSQQGLPGPASNLLGLLGVKFPQDTKKGKWGYVTRIFAVVSKVNIFSNEVVSM